MPPEIDERTIELISERVAARLRDELEAIAADIAAQSSSRPLTVEQVAEQFGVARSTVYAHWREWGGYKLGAADKAPIRFDQSDLPVSAGRCDRSEPKSRKRRRAELLKDNAKHSSKPTS